MLPSSVIIFEMCEIAISSYKHIGRIRSTRLVGKDLATCSTCSWDRYSRRLLKTFQFERWDKLILQTMLDLTKCYEAMGDKNKYVRMCAQIAINKVAASPVRLTRHQMTSRLSQALG